MILYFIDGKIDCFETTKDYPELENAYTIDAADGVKSCFDQWAEIEENESSEDFVLISNFLCFLDAADSVYLYNDKSKTFELWNDYKFKFGDKSSRVSQYLFNLSMVDWDKVITNA